MPGDWILEYVFYMLNCRFVISFYNLFYFVCLFVLRLNVPVNNFSVMSGRKFILLSSCLIFVRQYTLSLKI